MNFRRRKTAHAGVEAGSLSDILFFLMLFFLIVSTLASPNAIKLLLPKADTGQTIPQHIVSVSVTQDLKVYMDNRQILLDSLSPYLIRTAKAHDKTSVVLRMDKSVTVEELVKVVDAVNKARLPLVIATENKGA